MIMMVTVPHVTSGSGLRKFQADVFFLDRVYMLHVTIEVAPTVLENLCIPDTGCMTHSHNLQSSRPSITLT